MTTINISGGIPMSEVHKAYSEPLYTADELFNE